MPPPVAAAGRSSQLPPVVTRRGPSTISRRRGLPTVTHQMPRASHWRLRRNRASAHRPTTPAVRCPPPGGQVLSPAPGRRQGSVPPVTTADPSVSLLRRSSERTSRQEPGSMQERQTAAGMPTDRGRLPRRQVTRRAGHDRRRRAIGGDEIEHGRAESGSNRLRCAGHLVTRAARSRTPRSARPAGLPSTPGRRRRRCALRRCVDPRPARSETRSIARWGPSRAVCRRRDRSVSWIGSS